VNKKVFWRGLVEDRGTHQASHTKLLAVVGSIVASGIMIREALHDRMNSEYFWAYLGILVAGAAASKYLTTRGGNNNVLPPTTDVPEK